MFTDFFYFLREKGMNVSLSEWLSLVEALDKGLVHSNFTEFYYVARMILVKSENEFDKFDMLFDEYFKGIRADFDDITDQMRRWLDKPEMQALALELEKNKALIEGEANSIVDNEDVLAKFRERQKEQDSEHQGGN